MSQWRLLTQISTIAVAVSALWSSVALSSQTVKPRRIYVSEFVSASVKDAALLKSFTETFEESLVSSRSYTVLNRRNLQRIVAEAQSEQAVRSMSQIDLEVRTRLASTEGADGVVFGEVVDDAESGEITISVTLESFDSITHWKHSTPLKRGLLRDAGSRRQAMAELVKAIAAPTRTELDSLPTGNASGRAAAAEPPTGGMAGQGGLAERGAAAASAGIPKPQAQTIRGIAYTLESCRLQVGGTVCDLRLAHSAPSDQDVLVGPARVISPTGIEVAERIEFGSKYVAGHNWARVTVVVGVPSLIRLRFDRISDTPIERLEIESNRTERDGLFIGMNSYRVQFRKVPVVQRAP